MILNLDGTFSNLAAFINWCFIYLRIFRGIRGGGMLTASSFNPTKLQPEKQKLRFQMLQELKLKKKKLWKLLISLKIQRNLKI